MQEKFADLQELNRLNGMHVNECAHALKDWFQLSHSAEDLERSIVQYARNDFTHSTELKFIAGFPEFHAQLANHQFKTCIATNADRNSLQLMKSKMGLNNFFGEHIYCAEDVSFKAKPHPDLFLHAAAQLGHAPSECLVFEDSLHGFNAAKSAGMTCVAISNTKNQAFLHHVATSIKSYHDAVETVAALLEANNQSN